MLQTDSVANAVAFWIEIHAHSPEVFQWVINRGHKIGFELRRRLWDRLVSIENGLPDIPPRIARLWTLLLAEPPDDAEFLLRLDRILSNLSRDTHRSNGRHSPTAAPPAARRVFRTPAVSDPLDRRFYTGTGRPPIMRAYRRHPGVPR